MGAMLNGMAAHGGVVPVGVTYLVFSDYYAPDPAPGRDDGPAGAVRVQPRLHRHRPQRPDPSAGRVPGLAACDPEHAGAAPGRCGRGRRVLGGGAEPSHRPLLADLRPPAARSRCAAARPGRTFQPRRLCGGRAGGRRAPCHHPGDRLGGGARGQGRAILQAEGVPTAVVSMPSWELFEEQDEAYRQEVLGPVRCGWPWKLRCAWAGTAISASPAGFVGMSGFGASGPEDELFAHFGITPERVVAEVRL